MRLLLALSVAAAALLPIAPARAQDDFDGAIRQTLGGDPAAYRAFITTLQNAIRSGDAAGVAALVSYPITVTVDGKPRGIADAKAFAAAYPSIVTPAIAAGVQSEAIGDMMVNSQGVMLGNGEIWLTGVCAASDIACARPEIKVITVQPLDDLTAASPRPGPDATPGVLRSFGDWVAGCDNYRACAAVGMTPEDDSGAYVVIRRGGAAGDAPSVAFSFLPETLPARPGLRVAIDGGGTPLRSNLAAEVEGGFLAATVTDAAQVSELIAAMLAGRDLDIAALDAGKPGAATRVSLKGSAAALLYIDDQQRRVGTTTALARPGAAAAATIPPIDMNPVWTQKPVAALPDPLPPLPVGVAAPDDSSCSDGFTPMAFTLSSEETLWGVCAEAGAYNIDYAFWIVGPRGARKADFTVPGQPTTDPAGDPIDPSMLTSPSLSADGLALSSAQLGRGLGDCGVTADWGWDGAALRLRALTEMPTCRGVDPADWPGLFRAAPL